VPIDELRSLRTVAESLKSKVPNLPLHSLLALDLLLDKTPKAEAWKVVHTKRADVENRMPFMWPKEMQNLLPKPTKPLLEKQQKKIQWEWEMVQKAFPNMPQEDFLHAWFIVNSRRFHYMTPAMEAFADEDKIAMLPIADLFNHGTMGCRLDTSSDQVVTITTDRFYHWGEEIRVCRSEHSNGGQHSNDYLLAEYGVVLKWNRWDRVCLDDIIIPNLSMDQKAMLEEKGMLGEYYLNGHEKAACPRTQVVLRLLCCRRWHWRGFLKGERVSTASQQQLDALLKKWLENYLVMLWDKRDKIFALTVGKEAQRSLLEVRWKQIETMVSEAVERLIYGKDGKDAE
jgi:hypothetical protein